MRDNLPLHDVCVATLLMHIIAGDPCKTLANQPTLFGPLTTETVTAAKTG